MSENLEGFPLNRAMVNMSFQWALANIADQRVAEGGHAPAHYRAITSAIRAPALVSSERLKQVYVDGRTAAYDTTNNAHGELVKAAIGFAVAFQPDPAHGTPEWRKDIETLMKIPWGNAYIARMAERPKARLLLQAAALLTAELDRLLYNDEAYVCERCGEVFDTPATGAVVEALHADENVYCSDCMQKNAKEREDGDSEEFIAG